MDARVVNGASPEENLKEPQEASGKPAAGQHRRPAASQEQASCRPAAIKQKARKPSAGQQHSTSRPAASQQEAGNKAAEGPW